METDVEHPTFFAECNIYQDILLFGHVVSKIALHGIDDVLARKCQRDLHVRECVVVMCDVGMHRNLDRDRSRLNSRRNFSTVQNVESTG